MNNFTELQEYILKRMFSFERHDEVGIQVFSWTTENSAITFGLGLPSTFKSVKSLNFPTGCVWADLDNTVIITWRIIQKLDAPLVNLFRFKNPTILAKELRIMIDDPQRWLRLGDTAR